MMPPALYIFLGALAVVSALGVIVQRNPIHSLLALIGTLLVVAILFIAEDAVVVGFLQIIVYAPVLVLGFMLNLRHGFAKSSGWFFLITLSILRLIGAICWLVYASSPSRGVATAAIICTSIGLSPLTLLCMGLLSRV